MDFEFNLDLTSMLLLSSAVALIFGLGWLITLLRGQRSRFALETELKLQQQQVAILEQHLFEYQQAEQKTAQQLENYRDETLTLHNYLATAQEKLQQQNSWYDELQQKELELRGLRITNSNQQVELKAMVVRLEAAVEKQQLLTNSEQRLTEQFENLANRIFEQSGRKVDEQNKQSLHNLLVPLREQLDGFKKQVQDSFGEEAKERHTLAFEIRSLKQLNEQMAKEAINLTKALKGDNKTQGNWGEVVLSRVLQASGLREGYEYETQVSLKSEEGSRQQPDVIVRLPQEKDVVIDAKMTLVAYERYFNSEDEQERESALSEHLISLRNHIRLLSKKDYHQLSGLRSLDYVLMFIPVEPAFVLAIDREPDLVNEALKNNIMLVSPTTLLVALRTITNLWRYEYQSQNAQRIADRASRFYDKLRLFVDDMEMIGQSLDKAHNSYKGAMNKLSQGKGNLISQVEHLKELGVEVKKPISPTLVKQAMIDESEEMLKLTDDIEPLEA